MKRSALKSIASLLVAATLLFAFAVKPERANFSGEWTLNEGKSDLGQFGQFATRSIKVEQKADAIVISRTAPGFDGGDQVSTETLTFDGKVAESTVFGNSKRKATAKWSADEQKFISDYAILLEFDGQANEIKGTEEWTLSDGGKTLTVVGSSTSPFGDATTKSVFVKK